MSDLPLLYQTSLTEISSYEMYSGEQQRHGPSLDINPATGPAVELVEYDNGDMIWNIVDGLRDDDRESTYNVRASFASEYSIGGDSIQVTFKDRSQGGKRQSLRNSAFGSSLKPPSAPAGPASRPETKVRRLCGTEDPLAYPYVGLLLFDRADWPPD